MTSMFAHRPASQVVTKPGPGVQWLAHMFPHVPQLLRSVEVSTQAPLHTVRGARHWQVQVPLTQTGLKPLSQVQECPQVPQLPGSVIVLVQTPAQQVFGGLQFAAVHGQTPLTQTHRPVASTHSRSPLAQLQPHVPELHTAVPVALPLALGGGGGQTLPQNPQLSGS
jgi:hypothetical protein